MLAKAFILAFVCTLVAGSHYWEEEKHHSPQPYRFGYEVKDKEGNQYRHEEGDGHGTVKGSYGYTDDKGIYREVHYIADKNGFRAKVKTNEPGTANQDPANVKMEANPQHQQYHNVKVIRDYTPIVHKFQVAPIRPFKHYQQVKSYNLNNFSPIHSYSYKPTSFHKFRPQFNQGNSYRQNFGNQIGSYQYQEPQYSNFDGLNDFDNLESFGGFEDANNEDIEKIIEELKNKGHFEYSGNLGGLDDNDYKFQEFRNIGNHKYSRSSRKNY